jgi:hypothetical protein
MNAIDDTQKGPLAQPGEPAGNAVQAKARVALEITPKRFRLIVDAVFSLPLRLLDVVRDLFRMFY